MEQDSKVKHVSHTTVMHNGHTGCHLISVYVHHDRTNEEAEQLLEKFAPLFEEMAKAVFEL